MKQKFSVFVAIILVVNLFVSATMVDASTLNVNSEAFVEYNAMVTGEAEDISHTRHGDPIISDEVALYPVFERRSYENDEQIEITFELAETFNGVDIAYQSNGFSVVGEIIDKHLESGRQNYCVILSYDGMTGDPYFDFSVITDVGVTVRAKVYGYLSDYGFFISESSFDAAKSSSYYYLVESGVLTMDEYNEIMEHEYSQQGMIFTCEVLSVETTSSSAPYSVRMTDPITVSGNFFWGDDNDALHPLQYNKVEVWDDRFDVMLGVVYADASGDFSFTYIDEYDYRDIYIKIYAAGENATVLDGDGGVYVCTSPTRQNVVPGTTISISGEIYMGNSVGEAFQVSQAINVATQYVKQMNGEYIAPVTVIYPHKVSGKGCFYQGSVDTIYICGLPAQREDLPESYASWDAIMHEYGHHIQAEFNIANNPGGSHSLVENLVDKRGSKDVGLRLAWGEAYPSVFGGMAQAYYASTLQNIATVGDAEYRSYNKACLNYETPWHSSYDVISEACEGAVIGVLWDLYDTVNESHDTISFSHQNYWDMITNSGAYTMSDFCNYFINRYDVGRDVALGRLLAYYKISPTDVIADVGGETPSFSWTPNGTSSTYPNNRFDLIFLNTSGSEVLRVENIITTSYTLSEEEWSTVLCSYGLNYYVIVVAHQTASPVTGGYYSAMLQVAKPTHNESSELIQNTSAKTRYSEKVITLTPGSYYDLYVTFGVAGSKIIQTFGTKNTKLELYSSTGTLLVDSTSTSNEGYGYNDFLRYNTTDDTQYVIRVCLNNAHDSGTVKVVMTPAYGECATNVSSIESYEDILSLTTGSVMMWNTSLELNSSTVMTFTPLVAGTYTFELTGDSDTVLYVIDPRSSDAVVEFVDYDDDSGTDLNAKLTKTLEAGISYFIVCCGYNIKSQYNVGPVLLTILNNDALT